MLAEAPPLSISPERQPSASREPAEADRMMAAPPSFETDSKGHPIGDEGCEMRQATKVMREVFLRDSSQGLRPQYDEAVYE